MNFRMPEKGFTQIANTILEKTAGAKFSGTQYAILLLVWRYTFGYRRESHILSETFFANASGYTLRHVKRELAVLLSANVLRTVKEATLSTPREIAFNPDTSGWRTAGLKSGLRVGKPAVRKPDKNVTTPGDKKVTPRTDKNVTAPGDKKVTASGDKKVTPPGDKKVTQERKEKRKNKDVCVRPFLERFNRFWKVYPRRQAKREAMEAFMRIDPDEAMLEVITDAVTAMTYSEEWNREEGRFIPMPATYLAGRRWEDEETGALPLGTGRILLNETMKGIET